MKYTRLKNSVTGNKAEYPTYVKAYIKKDEVIFKFIVLKSSMNSFSDKYNSEIYNGDVAEVFFSIGKENKYFEFEIAPNKTLFFSEVTNINNKYTGNLLEKCPAKVRSIKLFNNFFYKISFNLKELGCKDYSSIEFNAFRIQTDNEKPNKYLFALSPTMCGSFHIREAFVKLK